MKELDKGQGTLQFESKMFPFDIDLGMQHLQLDFDPRKFKTQYFYTPGVDMYRPSSKPDMIKRVY